MPAFRQWAIGLALAPLLGVEGAWAQGAQPWVDPPADLSTQTKPAEAPAAPKPPPAQPAPPPATTAPPAERRASSPARQQARTPPPAPTEQTRAAEREPASPGSTGSVRPEDPAADRSAALEDAARSLAVDYLRSWSQPNDVALSEASHFYGSTVRYHGKVMNARNVVREKQRFAQRWPERSYEPRAETVETMCAPDGATCRVQLVFDYTAVNPRLPGRAEGTGSLELAISLAGERPVIIEERSRTFRPGRGDDRVSMEEGRDD